MKQAILTTFALAAFLGLTACDDENAFPGLVSADEAAAAADVKLVGFWTGTEEIQGTVGTAGSFAGEEGFTFPVALSLRRSGAFTLWARDFPVSAGRYEDRTCSGVYEREGRRVLFFPNSDCRPLPLASYVIGTTLSGGIVLEATSDPGSSVDVSVRIRVERD